MTLAEIFLLVIGNGSLESAIGVAVIAAPFLTVVCELLFLQTDHGKIVAKEDFGGY